MAIDLKALDQVFKTSLPWFASITSLSTECSPGPDFTPWEVLVGHTIYHIITPFVQFVFAVLIADSWQYFGHRWMHQNKFMYRTFTPASIRESIYSTRNTNYHSRAHPFAPSSSPRTLRLRLALYPPSRRVTTRHPRCCCSLWFYRHDHPPGDVVSLWLDCQGCL